MITLPWRFAFFAFMFYLLSACGGGGGSSSGGNSSSGTTNSGSGNSLTVSPSSISLKSYLSPDNYEYDRASLETTVNVSYRGDGVVAGVIPGEESALQWLDIQVASERPGSASFNISIYGWSINPYQTYSTTLRFVTGNQDGSNQVIRDVPFSAIAGRYFYADQSNVSMRRVNGADAGIAEVLNLYAADSSWSIGNKPAWLDVEPGSGTGDSELSLSCNATADALQNHSGVLIIRDASVGLDHSISVTCESLTSNLVLSDYGIALTELANAEKLMDSIDVTFSGEVTANWQAESDQAWLTITSAGDASTPMEIYADTSNLADNNMHYANVTVSPASGGKSEIVRVGLYKNTGVALEQSILSIDFPYVFLDPIRPYAYIQEYFNEVNEYHSLTAINIYTGEPEIQIDLSGQCLHAEDISPDGSKVFFLEDTYCHHEWVYRDSSKIYTANLFSNEPTLSLLVDIPESEYGAGYKNIEFDLRAVINNGVPAILLHPGLIYHAETGMKLGSFTRYTAAHSGMVIATEDATRIFVMGFIDADAFSLFLPSDDAQADVRKIATMEKFYFDREEDAPGRFLFHPDGDLILTPTACYRENLLEEWAECSVDPNGAEWAVLPNDDLVSNRDPDDDFISLGFYSKDTLEYQGEVTENTTYSANRLAVSSDALVVLSVSWIDSGARTEWRVTPLFE